MDAVFTNSQILEVVETVQDKTVSLVRAFGTALLHSFHTTAVERKDHIDDGDEVASVEKYGGDDWWQGVAVGEAELNQELSALCPRHEKPVE